MKPKHIKLIGLLLGVAVLLYLPRVLGNGEGQGSLAVKGGFAFATADPMTRIQIHDLSSGDVITLERAMPEWTVDGLRVDMSKIEEILPVLAGLSSDIIVARNPDNHEALGVAETNGRRIDVHTEAGGPYSFHVGNRDMSAGGYFVRAPGATEVFRLDGPAGGLLGRTRDAWRQRVIARVDVARVRDVMIRQAEGEVVLRRTDEGWSVDGIPADSATVQGLLTMLPSLAITDFPTDDEAAVADFAVADAELDVFVEGGTDVTDRELVLGLRFIQDETQGDWLARLVDGTEVYRMAPFVVRRLLPERENLLPEE